MLCSSGVHSDVIIPFIVVQVRSRGFTLLGDPFMIPGADMFNHNPNRQSVRMATDGDDHFVMKTVSGLHWFYE